MAELHGAQLVIFLNTALSATCSICTFLGLWPFGGIFHSWFYKSAPYTWTTHTMMAWFHVGCLGLFTTNVFALRNFTDETSSEAYELVFTTNALMHFLWGMHNLHLYYVAVTQDKGRVVAIFMKSLIQDDCELGKLD